MDRQTRILVVEDNPTIASALERASEAMRFHCDHATDGWAAIEKLENEHYAAIVIDTDLPRHSGFGVLTYLREVGDMEHVILMTSSDCEHLREKVSGENVQVIDKRQAAAELARVINGYEESE